MPQRCCQNSVMLARQDLLKEAAVDRQRFIFSCCHVLICCKPLWFTLSYCLLQTRFTSRNHRQQSQSPVLLSRPQAYVVIASCLNLLSPSGNICSVQNAYKFYLKGKQLLTCVLHRSMTKDDEREQD